MTQTETTNLLPPVERILGIPIAVTTYEDVLTWIWSTIRHKQQGYICVSAVHTVVACQDDPALRDAVEHSSFAVPDGQPLVWALNLLGHNLSDRVYGPELMARTCARAAADGTKVYLYGGRGEAGLSLLEQRLTDRFPGLKIVGRHRSPFRPLTTDEEQKLIADIDAAEPDVIWVGTGVPRQEKWMHEMRPKLTAPVLIGVGAAFDFHAGLVRQAPPILQKHGLEWAFRLSQEPRRLWRRYALYNPRFVAGFARQYWQYRKNGKQGLPVER